MAEPADQILTIGLSAVAGYGGKMAQDWWTARRARRQADRELWSEHKQQLYLPLLGAVRELETRLSELADVYAGGRRCRSPPRRCPGTSGSCTC
jgi:hypothetical protein